MSPVVAFFLPFSLPLPLYLISSKSVCFIWKGEPENGTLKQHYSFVLSHSCARYDSTEIIIYNVYECDVFFSSFHLQNWNVYNATQIHNLFTLWLYNSYRYIRFFCVFHASVMLYRLTQHL